MQTPSSVPSYYSSCCHNYAYCGGGTVVCTIDAKTKAPYRGTWDGFVNISRNEGILSLWRDLSPTPLMSLPATVLYFMGYETLRTQLSNYTTPTSSVDPTPLLAGGM